MQMQFQMQKEIQTQTQLSNTSPISEITSSSYSFLYSIYHFDYALFFFFATLLPSKLKPGRKFKCKCKFNLKCKLKPESCPHPCHVSRHTHTHLVGVIGIEPIQLEALDLQSSPALLLRRTPKY